MPPRHAFWTIIYGNAPTSFRAATPEELLPTLKQLQSTHPDAVMMWFARGRLWRSPEEARDALFRQRARRPDRRASGPARSDARDAGETGTRKPRSGEGSRGREWRPGGAHRDPRDRFKLPREVRRKRFAARLKPHAASPKPPRKKKDEE